MAGALVLCASGAPARAAFPDGPPNDPLYDASPLPNATNEQWDLASPAGGFDRGISVDRAWPLTTGAGTIIADVDLGVRYDHPDLAGRWAENPGETGRDATGRDRRSNGVDDDRNGYVDDWRGWDTYARDNDATSDTENAHGTNVAGVLGAAANNGVGIAGIAPGRAHPAGAQRRPHPARRDSARPGDRLRRRPRRSVISMSLGAESFNSQLRRAVAYAHHRGAVMAVASGNEFHFHHHYPQVMGDVLAVGGLNPDSANATAINGDSRLGRRGLHGPCFLRGLRPAPRRRRAHAGTDHGLGRRLHQELERDVGGHATRRGGGRPGGGAGAGAGAAPLAGRGDPDRAHDRGRPRRPRQGLRVRLGPALRMGARERLRGGAAGRAADACRPSRGSPRPTGTGRCAEPVDVRGEAHGRAATRWTLELGAASGRPRGPGWRPGGPPARSRSGWPASNGSRLARGDGPCACVPPTPRGTPARTASSSTRSTPAA